MQKIIFPMLTTTLILGVSSANAATPINLRDANFQDTQKQFHVVTSGAKKAFVGKQQNELKVLQQHVDAQHMAHIRLQQLYNGFNVVGGYAIVHSKQSINTLLAAPDNEATMNGIVYNGLNADLGQTPANYIKNGDLALQTFSASYQGNKLSKQSVEPVVYMDTDNKAHWAYKVSVMVQYDDKIPEKPTAILDAKTFKPFVQWNDIKTESTIPGTNLIAAKAKGFGGNPKMGEYQFGTGNYPYLDILRDEEKQLCYMKNDNVRVVDMKHRSSSSRDPMQFQCSDKSLSDNVYWTGYNADGYDRENGGYSATNDALYAGYVINHLYKDWYDLDVLTNVDGEPMELIMRVHYGHGYENAFWDGEQMTFGDGQRIFYPLVSLGVGSHEVSHGFTEQHSNLNYYGQSGGMNESFSDMAAQAAEYYSAEKSSWRIGAEITKEDSGYDALRYMDVPSRDGYSIDTADDYYPGLDVHYSSGVFNRLFYLLANTPRWDTRKAFDVMVKANMDYWTPYSSFKEGGCGVLQAAKDLRYPLKDVKAALTAVTINYKTCYPHQG